MRVQQLPVELTPGEQRYYDEVMLRIAEIQDRHRLELEPHYRALTKLMELKTLRYVIIPEPGDVLLSLQDFKN